MGFSHNPELISTHKNFRFGSLFLSCVCMVVLAVVGSIAWCGNHRGFLGNLTHSFDSAVRPYSLCYLRCCSYSDSAMSFSGITAKDAIDT